MALLKGEGTHQILYGRADIFSGLSHNRGYLARPDHAGSFPSVLLAHGSEGISPSVKSFARRLARHGLAVVGPDLYRGTPRRPTPDWPGSVAADLSDAFQWMKSADTPFVRSGPVGVLALGRAASSAIRFADLQEGVGAIVLISPLFDDAIPDTQVPVLGFYGKEDDVAGADARQTAQRRLGHGEWVLYGGVGHGLVDEAADDYRWDVAEDVNRRAVEFFERILEGASTV